jgi:hypothetical protein
VNGGNEATQLLRKMINCRTLGIPFNPTLHLPTTLDQPMALLKVSLTDFRMFLVSPQTVFVRTLKSKPAAAENKLAPAGLDSKTQLARSSEDHRRSLELKSLTLPRVISGREPMIFRRVPTTTTARRAPTTTSRVRKRIYRAPTAERQPQRSGDATCAVKWSAMLADFTSSCTVSTDRIRCDETRFTRADVARRVISRTEEVS